LPDHLPSFGQSFVRVAVRHIIRLGHRQTNYR
jgi:hypothetical protein